MLQLIPKHPAQICAIASENVAAAHAAVGHLRERLAEAESALETALADQAYWSRAALAAPARD